MTSFLRFPQVHTRVGLSRSTIYLKIENGRLISQNLLTSESGQWLGWSPILMHGSRHR